MRKPRAPAKTASKETAGSFLGGLLGTGVEIIESVAFFAEIALIFRMADPRGTIVR